MLDQTKTLNAIARLWKCNFAPDAGGFRLNPSNPVSGGRPYAMPGEVGLVMSTFPDPAHTLPLGLGWSNMYFNACSKAGAGISTTRTVRGSLTGC